ncbi:zinc finger protein weckle-like isoform X1 [Lutzomyia longipalpis]|uniref:zinc finger protein weckle-like isoform X1 n=1 Tax=Lutzomyia longipalpis TaxID=7200 RepID=UPI002483DCDA|nr:zinc finger protein weckle-like isoform X1 [Lutzomyia longipalpis]
MCENWRKWCRLCAKKELNDENQICENESIVQDLLDIAKKYFLIALVPFKGTNSSICNDCAIFLTKLDDFGSHCLNVDQMFNHLIFNENSIDASQLDLESIRLEFEVDEEDKEDEADEVDEVSADMTLEEDMIDFSLDFVDDVEAPPEQIESPNVASATLTPSKQESPMKSITEQHIETKPGEPPRKKKRGQPTKSDPPIVCKICLKQFKCLYMLNDHMKVDHHMKDHKDYYTCEHCDKIFSGQYILQAHKILKHQKDTRFICEKCGNFFATKSDFEDHKFTHLVDKSQPCPVCHKMFEGSLKNHMLMKHCKTKRKSASTY